MISAIFEILSLFLMGFLVLYSLWLVLKWTFSMTFSLVKYSLALGALLLAGNYLVSTGVIPL